MGRFADGGRPKKRMGAGKIDKVLIREVWEVDRRVQGSPRNHDGLRFPDGPTGDQSAVVRAFLRTAVFQVNPERFFLTPRSRSNGFWPRERIGRGGSASSKTAVTGYSVHFRRRRPRPTYPAEVLDVLLHTLSEAYLTTSPGVLNGGPRSRGAPIRKLAAEETRTSNCCGLRPRGACRGAGKRPESEASVPRSRFLA
jgi:hypothetical protein